MRRITCAAVVIDSLLLGFVNPVVAQGEWDAILGDIDSISIATGREQSIQAAPAVATVITAKEIKDTGARNIADILSQVPGFHIGISPVNLSPIYVGRGFTSLFNQGVLFLVDGQPRELLGEIPLDMIDRVEVIRGPGSSLYGADAFLGVVDIITKKEASGEQSVSLSAGTFDTQDVRLLLNTTLANWNVVGGFEYFETDGHEPYIAQDLQSLVDQALGTMSSFAPGDANSGKKNYSLMVNMSNDTTNARIRLYDSDNEMGIGAGASLDPFGMVNLKGTDITLTQHIEVLNGLTANATLDYSQIEIESSDIHYFPPGAFFIFENGVINNSDSRQQIARGTLDFMYSAINNHYLYLGVGYENNQFSMLDESRNYNVTDDGLEPLGSMQDTQDNSLLGDKNLERHLAFVYVQDDWRVLPDWTLTYGARLDRYDEFGTTINPRAVLVWAARYNLTLKLLYGTGFREPTYLETNSRQIPALRGNADLSPEEITEFEFAIEYQPVSTFLSRLNLFRNKTDKQIRAQNIGGAFRPENVGDQTGEGIEVEAWWDMTQRTSLNGYYAYQNNTDETTNRDAGYAPHHRAFLSLIHQTPQWHFNTRVTYVGDRDRVANDSREKKVGTYALVDVLLSRTLTPNYKISVDVRNVFDKNAEEAGPGSVFPSDIPLPGRSFYTTVTGNF